MSWKGESWEYEIWDSFLSFFLYSFFLLLFLFFNYFFKIFVLPPRGMGNNIKNIVIQVCTWFPSRLSFAFLILQTHLDAHFHKSHVFDAKHGHLRYDRPGIGGCPSNLRNEKVGNFAFSYQFSTIACRMSPFVHIMLFFFFFFFFFFPKASAMPAATEVVPDHFCSTMKRAYQ